MYKIIGADQKEYGPVSVEQLRQWISQGRVNTQTIVLPPGANSWKTMGELSEFAGILRQPVPPLAVQVSDSTSTGSRDPSRKTPLGRVSKIIGIISIVLFFGPLIFGVLSRGVAQGLDFGNMSQAMALAMLLGFIAFVIGVIAVFLKERTRATVTGIVTGGLTAVFPFLLLLVVSLLAPSHHGAFTKDKYGRTRLHWAAYDGDTGGAQFLLTEGADVNAKDNDGMTPLHFAALNGRKEVVELLLANKADVNAKNNAGETPLQYAKSNPAHASFIGIEKEKEDVMELLRQHGGKDPEIDTRIH
jgi:hypothetical protein